MSIVGIKTKALVAAMAMVASLGAHASPLTVTSLTGAFTPWNDIGGGVLAPDTASVANATNALGGNAAAPGGNLQLGAFGVVPAATLTGTGGGHTVTLSSLTLTDWTANGNALANRYIQDAATAAFGLPLGANNLATAITNFFLVIPSIGYMPWQLVSDPNISYVDITGNTVSVGLAGLLDASPFLTAISGIPLLPGKQASEVVKMTFDGSDPIYLYGFSATASHVTMVGDRSGTVFSGNYDVKFVPEPAGLALLGVGLLGLLVTRRRHA